MSSFKGLAVSFKGSFMEGFCARLPLGVPIRAPCYKGLGFGS